MFYNQQCWFMFIFIYIYINVLFIYIVYKYLGMTPSDTTVVLLYIYFFFSLVFPCFILFVCSSHLCILSYMHVPYGAFFINKEFEFFKYTLRQCNKLILDNVCMLCCGSNLSVLWTLLLVLFEWVDLLNVWKRDIVISKLLFYFFFPEFFVFV